jgi:hypothetical protein
MLPPHNGISVTGKHTGLEHATTPPEVAARTIAEMSMGVMAGFRTLLNVRSPVVVITGGGTVLEAVTGAVTGCGGGGGGTTSTDAGTTAPAANSHVMARNNNAATNAVNHTICDCDAILTGQSAEVFALLGQWRVRSGSIPKDCLLHIFAVEGRHVGGDQLFLSKITDFHGSSNRLPRMLLLSGGKSTPLHPLDFCTFPHLFNRKFQCVAGRSSNSRSIHIAATSERNVLSGHQWLALCFVIQ